MSSSHSICYGSLNCRSAANRAAAIHTIIHDHQLDVLALQETWIQPDSLPALLSGIAPVGCSVLHDHREPRPGGTSCDGGLAFIHRNNFKARVHPPAASIKVQSFELQVVKSTSFSSKTVETDLLSVGTLSFHPRPGTSPIVDELYSGCIYVTELTSSGNS